MLCSICIAMNREEFKGDTEGFRGQADYEIWLGVQEKKQFLKCSDCPDFSLNTEEPKHFQRIDSPVFTYSFSREQIFNHCLRQYYYNYYLSHNGWLHDTSYLSKQAYRLKNLTNISLLTGQYLHEAFANAISEVSCKNSSLWDAAYIRTMVHNKLEEAQIESKNINAWLKSPKRIMLFEEYYKHGVPIEKKQTLIEVISDCTDFFFDSTTWDQVENENIKFLQIDNKNFKNYFYIGDARVYCFVDLVFEDCNKHIVIVDWKTGKFQHKDKEQMLLYSLYVSKCYKTPIENIICRIEYLRTGEVIEFNFDIDNTVYLECEIREKIKAMEQYVESSNGFINVPLSIEEYPQNLNLSKCSYCNFKELCMRDIENTCL